MQNVEEEKTAAEYIQYSLICQPNGYEIYKIISNKIMIDKEKMRAV